MRALTQDTNLYPSDSAIHGRNEVLAREGIDTFPHALPFHTLLTRRNEVLAREGIDTSSLVCWVSELVPG